jgi:hypothetical protein
MNIASTQENSPDVDMSLWNDPSRKCEAHIYASMHSDSIHFLEIPKVNEENPFIVILGKYLIGVDSKLRIVNMNTARIIYENEYIDGRVIHFEPSLFARYKNKYVYLFGKVKLRASNRYPEEEIFAEIRVKCS